MSSKKVFEFEFEGDIGKEMEFYFKEAGISKDVPKKADLKAREAAGAYLLDSVVEGSDKNPIKPPELSGALKASGSAHIANQKAFYNTGFRSVQSPEVATPNLGSAKGKRDEITIGFNRPYAARWEVNAFTPGEISTIEGPTSNRWLMSHINTDTLDAFKIYTDRLKLLTGG